MRVFGLVFLACVAATGCGSEERQKEEFRQHFLIQCAQTVRAQPGARAGPDATAVCACVADKVFAGRSAAQINKAVNEQTIVLEATTQCAAQQIRGASGQRQ
jgi:hypothetical protein